MSTTPNLPPVDDEAPADVRREHEFHADLRGHQAELRRALRRLSQAARQRLDLGRIVSENAPAFLGGAFIVGLWIGSRHIHR